MRPERYYGQTITYWEPNAEDAYGAPAFGNPITFLGRWDNKSETILGSKGETVRAESTIHYPQDLQFVPDGYLCLGDQTGSSDPRQVTGANKIILLVEIPDLRYVNQVKVAIL